MRINHVGSIRAGWGESLVWDDATQRLYFVDCAANSLMWLDGSSEDPQTYELPSMPTGVVLITSRV